jgi:hypothetical protein
MSVTANTTYTASFPKRLNIMGAPDQVFQFNNFLECLIGGIKAKTISAIGTINTGSLCTQYLYAPQIHFNLVGKPIAFILAGNVGFLNVEKMVESTDTCVSARHVADMLADMLVT